MGPRADVVDSHQVHHRPQLLRAFGRRGKGRPVQRAAIGAKRRLAATPVRLWIETTHHAAFLYGGWAFVREERGVVSGAAGGERATTHADRPDSPDRGPGRPARRGSPWPYAPPAPRCWPPAAWSKRRPPPNRRRPRISTCGPRCSGPPPAAPSPSKSGPRTLQTPAPSASPGPRSGRTAPRSPAVSARPFQAQPRQAPGWTDRGRHDPSRGSGRRRGSVDPGRPPVRTDLRGRAEDPPIRWPILAPSSPMPMAWR